MVLIRELRFVLPITVEEYEIACMYTVLKMEQQNTTSKEGVETVESKPFEDEHLGKGQYTSKVYHLESKIPPWIRTFAPAKALTVHEESWNAFPKSKTVIKCPFFHQCSMSIETINKANNGCSENVHELDKKMLSQRKVEIIDITSISKDYWSKVFGTAKLDLSTFKSSKTGRGPLSKGWQETCNPVMSTYKLIVMDAPIWGFGSHLEEAMVANEKALLSEFHKLCFAWIDEWHGMTMEQIHEMEKQNNLLLMKTFQKSVVTNQKDPKRKNKHDSPKKGAEDSTVVPISDE
ncbi:phosphatidylinositol transfer protein 1-like [Canna indica]|uniref:Phosphatidylinositol transfer protein 1-like n=1 Tax=Canna indica TaxID=4628 RepID=A0AAQ3K6E8_9LILI|nr:phosphatidylinositol transfer protein 1-like [Canna indica]